MREKQQRRDQLPQNQKMREVNVIQHFCPKQMHDKMGSVPQTAYASELPSGNNFRHLHPVYKFVDSFLSNTAISKRTAVAGGSSGVINREFSQKRFCKKNERPCHSVRFIESDSAPKTCNHSSNCFHRASYQTMVNNKQENNVRNMSSHCCTPRTSPCLHRRQNNSGYLVTVNVESPTLNPAKKPSVPMGSDYYIDQLKDEIKQSKAQICQLITAKPPVTSTATLKPHSSDLRSQVDDEYVRKLKDELTCRKNKCICEARNIINELQNEITNFRLKAKAKYSSSCSDIGAGDQPPTSNVLLDAPKTTESTCCKKHEKQQPVRLSCSPRGESPRWTECETLWQSKKSLLSPDRTVARPVSHNINFEEKLEEAHTLIEKVRATLRDLGKGIQKSSEQKKMLPEGLINADCQCLNVVCSVREECVLRKARAKKESELKQDVKSQGTGAKDKEIKKDDRGQESIKRQKEIKKDIKSQAGTVKEKEVKKDDKPQEKDKKEEKIKKDDSLRKSGTLKKDDLLVSNQQDAVIKQIKENGKKTTTEDKDRIFKSSEKQEEKIQLENSNQADITNEKKSVLDEDATKKNEERILQESTKKEEEPVEIITIQPVKEVTSSDDVVCDYKPEDVSGSMDLLQEKLKVISEEDFTVPVSRMERGSSPINLSVEAASIPQSIKLIIQNDENIHVDSMCPKEFEQILQNPQSSALEQEPKPNHVGADDANLESVITDSILRVKVAEMLANEPNGMSPANSPTPHEKIKSARGSSDKVSRKSSEKSAKSSKSARLSVQLMPPVSIRGGLVMQKTLHLSIKPTGSVTNTVGENQINVGYKEITEADPTFGESVPLKCPDDCKNTEGGYCKTNLSRLKSALKEIDGAQTSLRSDKSKRSQTGADEDALNLYKSFQVLDDTYPNKRSYATLDTGSVSKRTEQLEQIESVDTVVKIASAIKHNLSGVRATSVSVSGSASMHKQCKNPWAMGFYKSKSTQCGEANLPDQTPSLIKKQVCDKTSKPEYPVEDVPSRTEKGIYERTISELGTENGSRTDVPVLEKSGSFSPSSEDEMRETQFDKQLTPDSGSIQPEVFGSTHSPDTSSEDLATPSTATRPQSAKSYTTGRTSLKSSLEESVKDASKSYGDANKDVESISSKSEQSIRRATHISMVEILSALRSDPNESTNISSKETVNEQRQHKSEPGKTKRKDERKEKTAKSEHDFTSTSSSSESSYNIHGSLVSRSREGSTIPTPSSPLPSVQGVKRPYDSTDDSMVKKTSIKPTKTIHDESKSVPKTNVDEARDEDPTREVTKKKGLKKNNKVEVEHEVSKETKPTTGSDHKVDANIQVSLESSESEVSSDSSFDEERERANTIAYFIKGLTGTSQEQLDKLRSSPSFPKTDLQSFSKSALKLSQEKRESEAQRLKKEKEEARRRSIDEDEVVVETLDYVKSTPPVSAASEDNLSESTKMERLREFQRLHGTVPPGDQKEDEKIVMRMKAENGNVVEGEHSQMLSKRHLPFYRRVLGRIIEPNSKRPMPKSLSDANPVEESISEGEINCKSSRSIGEISSYKHFDRKKIGKAGVKYLKKHLEDVNKKETGDQSLRIARQRTQYNNWVTYYLQRQHAFSLIDDSSSSSPVSRSWK